MGKRYIYETTLSWGGDVPTAEVDVRVSYTVAWGSSGSPRPYFGPPENFDPGAPSEVEDIRLELVEGKPRPWSMYDGYVRNEDDEFEMEVISKLDGHLDRMLEEAGQVEAAVADE